MGRLVTICSSSTNADRQPVIETQGLARNILANIAQTLVSALLLFALFRYVNTTLGVDQFGVWSVVIGTVSVARLADLGMNAGVTRFVARSRALEESRQAVQIIDTAVLTLAIAVGLGLIPVYILLLEVLPHLFDGQYLSLALEILPYALISLWLACLASVFQGGLDGCQRMDLRAALLVGAQALQLALALLLVPQHGLVGLAWAQIGQAFFLATAGRYVLRHVLSEELRLLPTQWRWTTLRQMLGYGANVQAASVMMLLMDPVTKALMARFGGPGAAGYFELANQLVLKARVVIVAANQAVVPYVAALSESADTRVRRLYSNNMRVLVFITLPTFALLFLCAGLFSWFLVGAYRLELIFAIWLVGLAWALNIFDGPAYFVNQGTGRVGWNTISHAVMGALNVGLGWPLGSYFGAPGVGVAYAIAVASGSCVLIAVFHRTNLLGLRCLFAFEHVGLAAASTIVALAAWFVPLNPAVDEIGKIIASILFAALLLGAASWFHPVRRDLWLRMRSVWDGGRRASHAR